MKVIVVGRHRLLLGQCELLRKAGLEVVRQIEQVPTVPEELERYLQGLKSEGVEGVVIQALPIDLFALLFDVAQRLGVRVYIFKIEAVALVDSEEEARRIVDEKPGWRTYLRGLPGEKIRVVEVKALELVKNVVIETVTVACQD